MLKALEWSQQKLYITDQNRLGSKENRISCKDSETVLRALVSGSLRGTTAPGVACAFALYLGVGKAPQSGTYQQLRKKMEVAANQFAAAMPYNQAVANALKRMLACADNHRDRKLPTLRDLLLKEALSLMQADEKQTKILANFGADLIRDNDRILLHGEIGRLATTGIGNALGILVEAVFRKKRVHVVCSEMRPFFHGSQITAAELKQAKIPYTLINDLGAGAFFQQKKVNLVMVPAYRVWPNGDVSAPAGTYGLALLAYNHTIPFYIVSTTSQWDVSQPPEVIPDWPGKDPGLLLKYGSKPLSIPDAKAELPAADLTPHKFISAHICDRGIIRAPYEINLKQVMEGLGNV
jgi:methylthioribose-1-phosphate isomerase